MVNAGRAAVRMTTMMMRVAVSGKEDEYDSEDEDMEDGDAWDASE